MNPQAPPHPIRLSVVLFCTLLASVAREASVSTTYSQPEPDGRGAAENTTDPPRRGSVPRIGNVTGSPEAAARNRSIGSARPVAAASPASVGF